MVIFCVSATLGLLLLGNSKGIALGLTKVDVRIKKISSRKTKSDMEAVLNSALRLFLNLIAIAVYFTGSCNKSINSVARASRIKTTFSIRATIIL